MLGLFRVPSLELDRKRAKRLLEAARTGEPSPVSLFGTHHPRFGGAQPQASTGSIALHDAELVRQRPPVWSVLLDEDRALG